MFERLKNKLTFTQTYYYSALLFVFSISLSRAAISFFVLWFVFLFLIEGNFKAFYQKIKKIHALKVIGIYIAYMFISVLWSNDISHALGVMRLYAYWIIIPILVVKLKKQWVTQLITAFLLGMLLSEVLAYGIFFELWAFNGRGPEYPSPFMFHIHYSLFLATVAIVLLNRLLSDKYTLLAKIPMSVFFLTSVGNLFISTGRTGQLAFLVSTFIAVVIHYRLTLKAFIIYLSLSTVLFVGAYYTISSFEKRINFAVADIQKLQEGNYNTSWGIRVAYWMIAYNIVKEDPLLGVGIGDDNEAAKYVLQNYELGFSEEVKQWCSTHHFHNQYLTVLVQGGLIGFALMIWLFVTLYRLKIKDAELRQQNILMLSVFVVSAIAEPLWIVQFPIILFVLIAVSSIISAQEDAEANI